MKHLILWCLLISGAWTLKAQNDQYIPGEWITIDLDMSDSMTTANLGFDFKSKLETKVLNIVSRNGVNSKVSCVKNNKRDSDKVNLGDIMAGIICRPKFEIYDEGMVDAGMEKLYTVKVSLSLFIMSVKGNVIFGSATKEYQGVGKNRQAALNNSVVNMTVKDSYYQKFLQDSRLEIVRYYDQMCGTILAQANSLAKLRQYADAIYLLWPIPKEVKCHEETRDTMLSIYAEYIDHACKNNLYNARAYMAASKYKEALIELLRIDAESACAPEAIGLMAQLQTRVDADQQRNIEMYRKLREDEIELEKERYRSMGKISANYNYSKVEVETKQ